jgi:hypothetical protein
MLACSSRLAAGRPGPGRCSGHRSTTPESVGITGSFLGASPEMARQPDH